MTAERTVIHSARLVSGGIVTPDAWVVFEGDVIRRRGVGGTWRRAAPHARHVVDAAGRVLTPGTRGTRNHTKFVGFTEDLSRNLWNVYAFACAALECAGPTLSEPTLLGVRPAAW